jgi:hypothetical protein
VRRPRRSDGRYRDPIDTNPPDGETESHWVRWHRAYDVDGSALRIRLAIVQRLLRDAIDPAPKDRPIRLLSLCAGRGTDVLGVLADHPQADRVQARLVELDPDLTARARSDAAAAGLTQVEIVTADASTGSAAAGAVPADVLLACGIFGNISPDDVRAFAGTARMLCAPGATVIWTRHRRPPDLTPQIRDWFADAGFDEVDFVAPDDAGFVGVGAHRLASPPLPFEPDRSLFTFIGDGTPS